MYGSVPKTSSWKTVALGLPLKLAAMWILLPSMLVPLVFPSPTGLLFAILFPLLIDLAGRCCCAWSPVSETFAIRLSILSQCTGILGLAVLSIVLGLGGVASGLVWAAIFQVSAAKWFVKYLKSIALTIEQPAIAVGLDQLRKRLLITTLSVYGSGFIAIVILSCAVVFGVMAYGIGLIITIPATFLMVMPLIISCLVLYFLTLYSYERSLSELRRAVYSLAEADSPIEPRTEISREDQPLS